MKKRHQKYTNISLKYTQMGFPFSETDLMLATLFDEKSVLWSDDCSLRLLLNLDNKDIFYACDINTLLEMYLTPGKYYPFTCDDCGDPGCAGIFAPSRIIHSGEDIILCLRSPLHENHGPRRSIRWRYHAYRLRKKDYLRELLSVMHFRISLENNLNIKFNETQDEEKQRQDICLLMNIFGLRSCGIYQKNISENIRAAFPKLKNELLEKMGVKNL
ncbi:MAG: hypothetical protein IJW31_03735 [Lentisphaeria bacterium]|nr:hypothetical protein [Lentisphaeria bacterium]